MVPWLLGWDGDSLTWVGVISFSTRFLFFFLFLSLSLSLPPLVVGFFFWWYWGLNSGLHTW
jgi:hypothetical protein